MRCAMIPKPDGLPAILEAYGDPRPWVNRKEQWENMTLANRALPTPLIYAGDPRQVITRVRAHRLVVDELAMALMACLEAGVPRERLKYGGAYCWRLKRGLGELSVHT